MRLTPSPAGPEGLTFSLSEFTTWNSMSATLAQVSKLRFTAPTTSLSRFTFELSRKSETDTARRTTPDFQRNVPTDSSPAKDRLPAEPTDDIVASISSKPTIFCSRFIGL